MTSQRLRASSELCLGFLVLLLAACSSAAGDDDDTAGGNGGAHAGSGGSSGPGTGGNPSTSTGAPAFRVSVTTANDGTTLCVGACTSLTASADQGVEPYTYTFDHDLGAGAGPHEVCPTKTTTYRVTVHDSSVDDDEFHEKNADVVQTITVKVAASCDGGVGDAGDGGGDLDGATGSGAPGTPGTPLCTERIAAVHDTTDPNSVIDIWKDDFSPKLAVDADDNIVMAITYQGTLDLADETSVTSAAGHDAVLIAKYDAKCKPLWFTNHTDEFGITEPTLAVDSKGHVIIAARSLDARLTDQALLLSAFDKDGDLLWLKRFDSAPGLHWQNALRVDANDDIVWLTAAASRTDFGGGMLGGAGNGLDPTMEVLVKFDRAGDHVWSKLIQESQMLGGNGQENGMNAAMAIINDTDIVFAGASIDTQDWGAGGQTMAGQAGQPHSYLVRANATGDFFASETTNSALPAQYVLPWIEVDFNDNLALARVGVVDLEVRSAPVSGMVVLVKPSIIGAAGFPNDWNKLAFDARRHIVLGGSFRTNTVVDDVALTAGGNASMDAFVQRLSDVGDVLWTYSTQDALGSDEWLLGMATDSTDNIATAIGTLSDTTRELYLVKLAP